MKGGERAGDEFPTATSNGVPFAPKFMDIKEYRKWLEKNGNQEEVMAYEVAEKIVNYHTAVNAWDYKVSCYPRRVFQTDRERLEFDLIIELEWDSNRHYKRVIGIEFKETDFGKVIVQAIARSEFVDYMYVATRNVVPDPYDLLRLFDWGIGWIVWTEDFVKLLFPAHYRRYSRVSRLIDYLARRALEEAIEEKKVEGEIRSLFEFIGGDKNE